MTHETTIDLPALAAALAAVEALGVSPALLLAYAVARNVVSVATDDGEGIDDHFSMWSQGVLEDGRDETIDHVNTVGSILTAMGLLGDGLTTAARKMWV